MMSINKADKADKENKEKTKSLLLVGVGGQGTILASKILSEGLMRKGYDVKMSEIHGMAQRGGSVSTHVRYGSNVASPVISKGEAHVIVAFEKVEAVRWIDYLRPGGALVVNDYEIYSLPVLLGMFEYPQNLKSKIMNAYAYAKIVKADKIAEQLGNIKAQNVVLLGALIEAMELGDIAWEEVLKDVVPPKFLELNIKALEAGMSL